MLGAAPRGSGQRKWLLVKLRAVRHKLSKPLSFWGVFAELPELAGLLRSGKKSAAKYPQRPSALTPDRPLEANRLGGRSAPVSSHFFKCSVVGALVPTTASTRVPICTPASVVVIAVTGCARRCRTIVRTPMYAAIDASDTHRCPTRASAVSTDNDSDFAGDQ